MKAQDEMKALAKRVQKESKKLGYEMKLNHALELVARTHFNQTWHVVSKREDLESNEEFELKEEEVLNRLEPLIQVLMDNAFEAPLRERFTSLITKDIGAVEAYIESLEQGLFKDRIVYGIDEKSGEYVSKDPLKEPGALYCGGMGSGKTIAMRFSIATHIVTNSAKTVYFLIDPLKGMMDYNLLYKDKKFESNIIPVINDMENIGKVITMIHKECVRRKMEFSNWDVSNINQYNEKIRRAGGKELANVMVCMEEFHSIPNSKVVKFMMNVDESGTVANKLKELMRVGRSYGITFLLSTQRATSEDIPSALKPGLTMTQAFRMNNPGEASSMNLPHASDINVRDRGRCAYDDGFIQYPYLGDDSISVLLKEFYKPLESQLLYYQVDEYREELGLE